MPWPGSGVWRSETARVCLYPFVRVLGQHNEI
jgi:hypothetical protein